MKKIYIIFCLSLFSILASAQIEIYENKLPSKDDTLYTHTDNIPDIRLGSEGGDKYWDFSSLSSGFAEKQVLKKNDINLSGINIDYDFYTKEGDHIIKLYKKKNGNLMEVGIKRPHPLNSKYSVIAAYSKPKLIRIGRMSFGTQKSNTSLIYLTLPGNQVPSLIQKKIPITADSIRIKIEEIQNFELDAWGTLRLSHNIFNVLRLYQHILKDVSVEVFSTGKWLPINSKILDPNGELLGKTTEILYQFYDEEAPEPIVSVQVDYTGSPLYAQFKASPLLKNVVNMTTGQKEYIISPNPSFGDVKLELLNADFGPYTFELYNVIGKRLWSKEIKVDKNFSSHKLDFSFLGKGTYVWALTDNRGTRVTTKRLIILTP